MYKALIMLGLFISFCVLLFIANFVPAFESPDNSKLKIPVPIGDYKPSLSLPGTSMSLEAIAGRLFGQYLEYYMTENVSDSERVIDYRIDQVSLIQQKKDSYTVQVVFSVRSAYTDNSWVKGKLVYVNVNVNNETYTMEGFTIEP